MTSKVVPKLPVIYEIVPKTGNDMYCREMEQRQQRKAGTEILMLILEQSLEESVTVFKEVSRKFNFFFSLSQGSLKV